MNYKISRRDPSSKYLTIEATFKDTAKTQQKVLLPAWRPGRYEIQNFAKFIKNVSAFDTNGKKLTVKKFKKDGWKVSTKGAKELTMRYEFYADIQNAGGSFVDDSFLYLNPINCCFYIEDKQHEACKVEIEFKNNADVACGMPSSKNNDITTFKANSFHDLVDSPIMISSKIQHNSYKIGKHIFHIWVKGKIIIPWEKVLLDFKKFTECQIEIFGEFPEPEYHFMLWMMPTAYYHGVEHRNGTMMTLGPDLQNFDDMYIDLLGLASHELFHTWNVKRIRPKELLPYDYSKENYFETCFVAEGLTTFYGDWVLYRSGVFDKTQYQKELETTLKRHFETANNASQSLLEASYDLWLDGYQKGSPDRKVSVYHKGAIASLILHHIIQQKTNGNKGLDDVMKMLWITYGKPYKGYSYQDYKTACETIAGKNLASYFREVIAGNLPLREKTQKALKMLGFEMNKTSEGHLRLDTLN